MWAWFALAAAWGGDVLVREDRRLLDVEVIQAQIRAGHRPLGIDTIVPTPWPGTTDDVRVLSGGLGALSDRALRETDAGTTLATWLEEGENLVVLEGWSPLRASLVTDGAEVDRLFVPFLPPTLTGGATATVAAPTCAACGANAFCLADGDATGTCTCQAGYEPLVPGPGCADVDECAADPCGPNAVCTDFDGGFSCDCVPTSTWDAGACTDPDQCTVGSDLCDPIATCIDTPDGYGCDCPDGYDGDGLSCADVDECAEAIDACDVAATCTNTPGGYTCACPDGWTTEGLDCTPPVGVPDCGNGVVEGAEACDDGDEQSGDGCSATCTLESGWVCVGTECEPDRDLDGVADGDDLCPDDYDPDQIDADDDGVGDACQGADTADTDDPGGPDGAGSCGCAQGGPLAGGWPAALLLLAWRRPRRPGVALRRG